MLTAGDLQLVASLTWKNAATLTAEEMLDYIRNIRIHGLIASFYERPGRRSDPTHKHYHEIVGFKVGSMVVVPGEPLKSQINMVDSQDRPVMSLPLDDILAVSCPYFMPALALPHLRGGPARDVTYFILDSNVEHAQLLPKIAPYPVRPLRR